MAALLMSCTEQIAALCWSIESWWLPVLLTALPMNRSQLLQLPILERLVQLTVLYKPVTNKEELSKMSRKLWRDQICTANVLIYIYKNNQNNVFNSEI